MSYDFSGAKPANSFDLMPAKTQVPVIFSIQKGDPGTPENAMKVTQTGLYQLVLEATITEGDFASRKIWHRLTMGARPGLQLTEGQEKAVSISNTFIRSLLEAARGVAPTDESAEAQAARRINSIFDLEGLECWIEIGVEKSNDPKYDDRNTIRKIIPISADTAGKAQAATPPQQQRTQAPQRPAAATKPAWA